MTSDQHKGEVFQRAICKAIQAEREATPNSIVLRVLEVSQEHVGCRVRVGPLQAQEEDAETALVDDRFDNAHVVWHGKFSTNKVIVRLHQERENELQFLGVSAAELDTVKTIELRCFDFFISLRKAWQDTVWSAKAFDSYTRMDSHQKIGSLSLSDEPGAQRLSPSQIGALALVNQSTGYLWGPPGTGKTETGAVMLKSYLTAKPSAKILVLGIANFPVDQLLIRLDKLLKDDGRNDIRTKISRFGSGVGSEIRFNHSHLLPGRENSFMTSPNSDKGNIGETDWELENFDPNQKIPHLFAMTLATATQKIEQLRSMAPFDLVLIEEASQAPLAQVLLFAPLAKSIIYAGDPAQLAPVAACQRPEVRRWMAASAFDSMPPFSSPAVFMLTEQRRMGSQICKLVSEIGYKNQLHTSSDCLNSKSWKSYRHHAFGHYRENQTVIVHPVIQNRPSHSKKLIREESAHEILELLQQDAGRNVEHKDIFVVTPFQAQARYLRRVLHSHGFFGVRVSTVHKTQGKEARIVIFDPVDGTHSFLKSKEAIKLLTVAFSRAESKLLVMATERDLENPILRMAKNMAAESEAEPMLLESV